MEKTLVIERPEGLSGFTKSVAFSKKIAIETWKLAQTPGVMALSNYKDPAAFSGAMHCLSLRMDHVNSGCIVTVSKEVSGAMEASRMSDAVFDDVPFLAPSIEFIWEDPALPNCIISNSLTDDADVVLSILLTLKQHYSAKKKGSIVCVSIPDGELKAFMQDDIDPARFDREDRFDAKTLSSNTHAIRYMISLCLRVLAYAAVPQVKQAIERPVTRKERKKVGVFRDHTELPPGGITHLRNLPRVVREAGDAEPSVGDAGSRRSFLGRLGHIRYFKSERFSEAVRGTWKWIAPVMPPEGVKLVYQVSAKPDLHKAIN